MNCKFLLKLSFFDLEQFGMDLEIWLNVSKVTGVALPVPPTAMEIIFMRK